jgi:glutathione S-transferase
VRKVRIAAAEKGIDYEMNPVMPIGVSDEYKQKSPLGKIPCWEDGDFVLPDSSCIIAYFDKTHSDPSLYPSDPAAFGRALWYEEYADTKVIEVCGPVFFERVVKAGILKQPADEEKVKSVIENEQPPVFDYLEGEIGDREYLAGGRFSIADIATVSPFTNLMHGGVTVDAGRWPNLAAYVERIWARPSLKALIEEEKAGFASQ